RRASFFNINLNPCAHRPRFTLNERRTSIRALESARRQYPINAFELLAHFAEQQISSRTSKILYAHYSPRGQMARHRSFHLEPVMNFERVRPYILLVSRVQRLSQSMASSSDSSPSTFFCEFSQNMHFI